MKAAILEKLDGHLVIKDVELTQLKVGQVLVKVIMSGLCGSQLQEISGLKGNANFLPHLLGHEGSGEVQEIGPGVTKIKVGDKVIMHWRKGDGIESDFPNYILDGKKISSGKVTTLSEFSIVSENRVTKVPNSTPDYLCALLGCGLSTALGVINNEANLKFGESVLVIGCGGVGLCLIQAAKLASAYPIIGLDIVSNKKHNVEKETPYFITNHNELVELLKTLNIKSIDVIIDTTGNTEIIAETVDFLSENGRYILVGQPKPGKSITIPNGYNMFIGNGRAIKATQGGKTNPTEDIPKYIRLYEGGYLNIENIVTHEFRLNEINEAIDLLKSGNAGRIMIKIN
jgi:Zn-dependent alcohol dehydrogenase